MIKTNIKKCIFPFIAGIVGGCNHHHLGVLPESGVTNDLQESTRSEFEVQDPTKVQSERIKAPDYTYIIFLPGFTETSDNQQGVPKAIRNSLAGNGVDISEANCIVSKARDSSFPLLGPTVSQSLDAQADLVIKEIANLPNTDRNGKVNIFIAGYSQGGLLLSYIDQKIKASLGSNVNLLGLISINAPWKGAPLLAKSAGDINQFVNNNREALDQLNSSVTAHDIEQSMTQKQDGINFATLIQANGLLNMLPGDECTKKSAKYFREECTTDRLIVGSWINLEKTEGSTLNNNFAEFATGHPVSGGNMAKHDTMLPFSGQLVRSGSFNDVNLHNIPANGGYIDAPKDSQNMKVFVIEGVSHAGNVVALHEDLFMKHGSSVLANTDVLNAMARFVKDNLPSTVDASETSN